jgi:hypothetical protein
MINGDDDEKSCREAINMIMMITTMVHNMNEDDNDDYNDGV